MKCQHTYSQEENKHKQVIEPLDAYSAQLGQHPRLLEGSASV